MKKEIYVKFATVNYKDVERDLLIVIDAKTRKTLMTGTGVMDLEDKHPNLDIGQGVRVRGLGYVLTGTLR